jgi:putative hydrolase of the HAD superfamily
MIEIIAFDADDTLWHNETVYMETNEKFKKLMASQYGLTSIDGEVYQTEKENILHFGYGVKSFTISMIETAIRLTGGQLEGRHVLEIANFGREMLATEVQLIEGAEDTVAALAASYPLMLITKGDQFEQDRKIERSGLASYFNQIEIVSEKSTESYAMLLARYGHDPAGFVMVGNSLRSDILPVVTLGGRAIYIPYDLTWEHETIVDEPLDDGQYIQLESLNRLVSAIDAMEQNQVGD